MMHHLTHEVGWVGLTVAAVLAVLAAPAFVQWVRFEIALSRRIRRRARIVGARDGRARW